jgi:hypothetical protein
MQLENEFTDSYRTLLIDLRARLGPNALIIVIQPAPGQNAANQKVAQIVESLRSAGDPRLYQLQFPQLQLTGCDFHPNLSDHRLMGATLVKFIVSRRRGTALETVPGKSCPLFAAAPLMHTWMARRLSSAMHGPRP